MIAETARPQSARLFLPVALVSAATVTSLLLAIVRDVLIADWFGASIISDVFFFALVIPTLFENVIGISLKDALIPFLTETKQKGAEFFLPLVRDLQGIILLASGLFALACWFLARPLVALFAPGFSPEAETLAVISLQIVSPIIALNALLYFGNAVLNIHDEFLLPALRPVLLNLGIIGGGFLLRERWGGAQALSIGLVIGLTVQLGIQFMAHRRKKISWRPSFSLSSLRLMVPALWVFIPVFISAASFQVNVLVDRMFASGQGEGSVALLSFAFRLATLPMAVISLSLVTVVFPRLVSYRAREDMGNLVRLTEKAMRNTLLLMFPASVGLIIISQPLVALLLQHGAFDASAAQGTVVLVALYGAGLLPYAGIFVMSRSFFALGDAWTPAKLSLAAMILNILLDLILLRLMGLSGLALATTCAFTFNFTSLMIAFWRHCPLSRPRTLALYGGQVAVATLVMAFAVLLTRAVVFGGGIPLETSAQRLVTIGVEVGIGVGSFLIAARLLEIEDIRLVTGRLSHLSARLVKAR